MNIRTSFLFVLVVSLLLASGAVAMPPHPDLAHNTRLGSAATASQVEPSYYLTHREELRARGLCQPTDVFQRAIARRSASGLGAPSAAPFRILAILVDFTDHESQVPGGFFDSLVFGSAGATVKHYFNEISYNQIDLVTVNLPSALGWRTAPQTYQYYVNNQEGLGTYPQNSQKLVEDLVDQVDPLVNYADYDNDGDGYVDVIMVIHSGRGAEFSGANTDIWSHKWAINPRLKDGVRIFDYTMQPEYWTSPGDMTIGVYSHELAHGFGLPDLYDTDGSSNGIGRWCLMALGSWNGPGSRGGSPAHPCAWARVEMGFSTTTNVTSALPNQAITNVEQGGPIYRLWTAGAIGSEYFLVENRQKIGYDAYLPGSGLLIYHIDAAVLNSPTPNDDEWYPGLPLASHYGVALEQADGLFELEHAADAGDAADPWPGTTNSTTFSDSSTPEATGYNGAATSIQVANISQSGQTVYANLIVTITAGTNDDPLRSLPMSAELKQNYPNPFNPSTTIEFGVTASSDVKLDIYNIAGQKVRTLYDGRVDAGTHMIEWDASDDAGLPVASGIYLYRLAVGDQTLVKKMALIR